LRSVFLGGILDQRKPLVLPLDLERRKAIAATRRKAYEVREGIMSSIEELAKVAVVV
jgi:hypothetical protein